MIGQHEIDGLVARYIEQEGVQIEDIPPQTERRRECRWKVFDQYAYLYHGMEYGVRIRDISLSGMRVADVPRGLYVGAQVRIVATLGVYGLLATTCQVMHVFEMREIRYAGLKFAPRVPQELESLAAYLDASQ